MFAKSFRILAIAGTIGGLFAMPASAREDGATAAGFASATVIAPLTVSAVSELDFGTVAVTLAQGGSVTVAPGTGGTGYSGSARQACLSGPACALPHPARFRVGGEAGRDYLVALPERVVARPDTADASGLATDGLAVDGLVVRSASRPGEGGVGRLDAQGHDRLEIGGTIRIPAGAAPARYSATVAVVLTYG